MALKFLLVLFGVCWCLVWNRVEAADSCSSSPKAFPEQFSADVAEPNGDDPINIRFPFLEAALQIFIDLKIPCDGLITEWRFWSAKTTINGLHLGVFRLNASGSSAEMISDSYINNYDTQLTGEGWVSWKMAKPIDVQYGDVLGLFYDSATQAGEVSVRSLTISSDPNDDDDSSFDTMVFLIRSKELSETGGKVDFTNGFAVKRVPSLYVTLERSPLSSFESKKSESESLEASTSTLAPNGTTTSSSEMKAMCGQRPSQHALSSLMCNGVVSVRFYYHTLTRFCREFIHCSATKPNFLGFASYRDCMHTCRKSFITAQTHN